MPLSDTYLDLGFNAYLNREVGLFTFDLETTLNDMGTLYNDSANLVTSSVPTSLLESGEVTSNLVLALGAHIRSGQTAYDTGTGFWIGDDDGTAKLSLGNSAGDKMTWNGSALSITGTLTATSGSIGGWTINATDLTATNIKLDSGNEQILVGSATAPLTGVGVFIGKDGSDYEFRAGDPAGAYMHWSGSSLALEGATVTGLAAGSEASIQSWTYSGVFSVSDSDTVAWASGTLTLMDGTTYSITGANTGNMTALNYIYLDIGVSTTVFQVATSFTPGSGKVLIATAQDGTSEASYILMGGDGSYNIDGGSIAAASIIAGKLSVSQLSAIAADLGTITAGTVTGATLRTSASGSRVNMDTSSLIAYDDSSNEVFKVEISGGNVGDVTIGSVSDNEYVQWDKSAGELIVKGVVSGSITVTAGHDIVAGSQVAFDPATGKIVPTTVSAAIDNTELTGAKLDLTAADILGKSRMFLASDNKSIAVVASSTGGGSSSESYYMRLGIDDPTDSTTYSSSALTTITSAQERDTDAIYSHAHDHVLITYVHDSPTVLLSARVMDLKDDTTYSGTDLDNSGNVRRCAVALDYDEGDEACVFYTKNADTSVYFQWISWNTTTGAVSAGTERTLFTASGNVELKGVFPYGQSNYYLIVYSYSGATYCRAMEIDATDKGSTPFGVDDGSEQTFDGSNDIHFGCGGSWVSDTKVVVAYNNTTDHEILTVDRSGTTATVNSAVTIGTADNSDDPISCVRWSRDLHIVGYRSTSNFAGFTFYEHEDDGFTSVASDNFNVGDPPTNSFAIAGRFNSENVLMCFSDWDGSATDAKWKTYSLTTNYDQFVGIAEEAITEDSTGLITYVGKNDDFVGMVPGGALTLTTGQVYYVDTEDFYSIVNTTQGKVGFATSSTEIIVK